LGLLEEQSRQGSIDLLYGDETGVNQLGYVPYAWQFKDEKLGVPSTRGKQINCFGLVSRSSQLVFKTSYENINAGFIVDFFEKFSLTISRTTVIVLDNARIHIAQKVKERMGCWQQRGLFLFFLPPYSPHLNLCERVWKELKARWLNPQDYLSFDRLAYAVTQCLYNVGTELTINFSNYC
jgi:transposase